ncbi:MAG: hypothetical protein LBK99_09880 [Opitutaceae bacterium]|jgi:hypothetical protein|nr:hypothetical protein [Opitutaceae bacterium]
MSGKNNNCGFTLFEAVLSLAVTVVVVTGLAALLFAAHKETAPQVFVYSSAYGTHEYARIPSGTQFRRAAELVVRLQGAIDSASAVFVLGGNRSVPSADESAGSLMPLKAGCLVGGVIRIAPQNLPKTSHDFRENFLKGQSDVVFETTADPADFTILTIAGLNTVSSITQVRRHVLSDTVADTVFYEVVFDEALSSARIDNADNTGNAARNRFSYRVAMTAREDANWTIRPGALHYWFRHDPLWQRLEEAPTRIILPDPFLLAGANPSGDTVPFSRFIFFVSPTP